MNASILAMLSAQILSILGSAIAAIAIPWLLLEAQVGPDKMAGVFAVQSCAAVLAAIFGTPFLDRYEKRRVYIGCDLLLAGATFALISLYLSGLLTPLMVALILAFAAVVSSFSEAAGSSMIPELVEDNGVTNQRVNGLIGTFHNFGDLAGPAIGGLVIAGFGAVGALAIDGVSFVLSAVLLLLFVARGKKPAPAPQAETETLRTTYLGGIREIGRDPVLRTVTFISAIINMVITPLLVLLLPVMVKQAGGSALGVGSLISCFGVGAFLASLLYTWKNSPLPPLQSLLASVLLALAAFVLIPLAGSYVAYIGLFLIGASVGYLGPLEQTLMQNSSPPHLIGRIMLAYSAFRTLLVPVGFFIVGGTLARIGVSEAFFALAALLGVAALSLLYSLLAESRSWAVEKQA
ncbi:MFS transporter [Chitinimonas lacunae]|uniref:MFS transporter n=1 Tax=Chitinimonas lacunae TaxID=1963018 RepID=A0ABV8MLX8_9NEIS